MTLVYAGDVLRLWLAERERAGLDGRDEMWNGVLHLVPPASGVHQRLSGWLYRHLYPIAEERGLLLGIETGLFAAADDYKVPDLVAASAAYISDRGVEVGAELVIEIQSPGDETMDKIPWYLDNGVGDLVIVHRDTLAVQVFSQPAWEEDDSGWLALRSIPGVAFRGGEGFLDLRLPGRDMVTHARYPS